MNATQTITLDATDLRHVMRFRSTEERRPMLGGVCIETTGVMVATDGHTLLAIQQDDSVNVGGNLLPRDVILSIPKAPPVWAKWVTVAIPVDADVGGSLVITYTNEKGKTAEAVARELAGPFPAWRQVMPRKVSTANVVPPLNPNYVARFAFGDYPRVRLLAQERIERAVLVQTADPRYMGCIMPVREVDVPLTETASWATSRPVAVPA